MKHRQTPSLPPDFLKIIGQNIAKKRRAAGLRQIDVVKLSGVPERTFCSIENGKVTTTLPTLLCISMSLKMTGAELMDGVLPSEVSGKSVVLDWFGTWGEYTQEVLTREM